MRMILRSIFLLSLAALLSFTGAAGKESTAAADFLLQPAEELPQAGFAITESGIRYRQPDGSFLRNSWVIIGSQAWCFDDGANMVTGRCVVDGRTWLLTREGSFALLEPDQVLTESASEQGFNNENTGLTVPNPDSPVFKSASAILSLCTAPDMSPEQKLRSAYDYIVNNTVYERTYDTPSGDWTAAYALDVFTKRKGNCYRYAAAFAYLAKALGFDARVDTGSIASRKGGYAPHGWVEIPIGNRVYLFDPEMQYAKKGKKDYYCKTYEAYPSKPLLKAAEWPVNF